MAEYDLINTIRHIERTKGDVDIVPLCNHFIVHGRKETHFLFASVIVQKNVKILRRYIEMLHDAFFIDNAGLCINIQSREMGIKYRRKLFNKVLDETRHLLSFLDKELVDLFNKARIISEACFYLKEKIFPKAFIHFNITNTKSFI